MISVNFKQLVVTNFYSIGNTPVIIDFTPGTHIITGINKDKTDRRNGVGKSSIIKSFYYAIIGAPIDNVKKEFLSNNITGKGGKLSLTFDVIEHDTKYECKVERSVKPAKCTFIVNGVDKTRDSIANTTKDICDMLHVTPEILENCVIMSLNDNIPFMKRSKNEKREFIEHIFRLEVFNDMFNDAKTEYNTIKKDTETKKSLKSQLLTQQTTYIQKQKQAEEKIKFDIEKLETNKQQILSKIEDLTSKLNNIKIPETVDYTDKKKELTTKQEKCQKKIDETNTSIGELNAVVSQLKQQLQTYNNTKTNCPTCGRPFEGVDAKELEKLKQDKQFEIDTTTLKLQDIKKDMLKFKEALNLIKSKIETYINQEKEADKTKYLIQTYRDNIENFNENVKLIDEQINTLKQTSIQSYTDVLLDIDNQITAIGVILRDLEKQLYIADMCKYITSEEGIKSYLIKKIIDVFNSKLDYYIKKLDGNSICIFNEFFDETMSNINGKQCSYDNFSGAERKAIDLACLFTFMDMRSAQGNVTYNVSFYDELFDSSLDDKGIRKVADILTERVNNNNECVYVVTHRPEIADFASGETITLVKENGITTKLVNK